MIQFLSRLWLGGLLGTALAVSPISYRRGRRFYYELKFVVEDKVHQKQPVFVIKAGTMTGGGFSPKVFFCIQVRFFYHFIPERARDKEAWVGLHSNGCDVRNQRMQPGQFENCPAVTWFIWWDVGSVPIHGYLEGEHLPLIISPIY